MKKTATLFIAGIVSCALFAQNARLVFAGTAPNEAYVTFNPNPGAVTTYMVIDNDAANAITQLAAGNGNIKSEHQNNRIRWRHQVGPLAVNYVIPWTTASNVKIPLTISKTAGTATHDSASFVLATFNHQVWAGSNANTMWQNVNYMPTGVTHMNDFYLGSVDNSENAVNRFWIIDPKHPGYAYTTAPNATMTFTNNDLDIDVGGAPGVNDDVLTTASQLQAQRFNPGVNKWGDYQSDPLGSAWASLGGGRSQVSGVVVTNPDFFRSWTLSSITDPLPVELTAYNAACDGGKVKVTWTTASEIGTDRYVIEKSANAMEWAPIGEVAAAGNSTSQITYTYYDEDVRGMAYYRLSQVDVNEQVNVLPVMVAGCDATNTEINNAWDDGALLNVVVSSTDAYVYDLVLTDMQGRTILNAGSQAINPGYTTLRVNKNGIATGLYMVMLQNSQDVMTRRVYLH
ncbi:MAG: hypothetical protein JST41_12410 [Bacteroidetes bacterium]|nr:hypothetical protein [Bacteroidota bacterium]MBX7128796.1 hypothetical protein [Flavobacteriales bacterium]MCC6655996.1 hypothetical protein [Flavobacteriales bacterium]HMU15775.1 hypothetical protein [Flavobacteriales bacterium]HMW97695.1 hypothetical protein [Flavobacteriales bacterium]